MNLQVLLFSSLADAAGVRKLEFVATDNITVAEAIDLLAIRIPELTTFRPQLAVAVNMTYVQGDHLLAEGDELALIPPVSGG